LRQANGRPQCAHVFTGRSAFERIFAMPLPSYGLATPAENNRHAA
jgi:hypothetical protein